MQARSASFSGGAKVGREIKEDQPRDEVEFGHLAENLPFLTRVLRAFIRAENAVFYADSGLELGEIAILNLIGVNPGLSQNDLAAAVVLKKSAVTKIVKLLEARGLVERRKIKTDKRYNALTLTEAGKDKLAALRDRMNRQQSELLSVLNAEERDQLFVLLNRLVDHLGERNRRGATRDPGSREDRDKPPIA